MSRGAILIHLGLTDYREAWALQRALAAAVTQGSIPDTVVFLEHPPTVTLGRRTEPGELHIPDPSAVAVVETDRGGRSTYHAPGQLVCYPILDLNRHGRDVRRYCRSLEQAIIVTLDEFGIEARRIEGLTGVWVHPAAAAAAKIASIGVHISRWVTTHGYALNVDLDPAPFTEWITACGLEDTAFTSMAQELGRPLPTDEVETAAATALAGVFGLEFSDALGGERALWPEALRAALEPGSGSPLVASR
jgi:lipoyl(octanoyl) transferase